MTTTPRPTHRLLRLAWHWLRAFGVDGATFLQGVRGFIPYLRDYRSMRRQLRSDRIRWPMRASLPCLTDRYEQSGVATGHYFHQDLLVARKIFERKPQRHVDVGSHVEGFVAHVAAFREIEVFDIRPLTTTVTNIVFRQCDLTCLPPEFERTCDSLSCLHALEHFGLGRYSDTVDVAGHEKGFCGLSRLLRPGGILYLSVPIGVQRIEFNAHRVFAVATVLSLFKADFDVIGFSFVDDGGTLHEDVELEREGVLHSFGLQYGCGIFECQKRVVQ